MIRAGCKIPRRRITENSERNPEFKVGKRGKEQFFKEQQKLPDWSITSSKPLSLVDSSIFPCCFPCLNVVVGGSWSRTNHAQHKVVGIFRIIALQWRITWISRYTSSCYLFLNTSEGCEGKSNQTSEGSFYAKRKMWMSRIESDTSSMDVSRDFPCAFLRSGESYVD